MAANSVRSVLDAPRWMIDEMLGRLARYLRFLGHDTEYAHGLDDGEILRRASAERRTLITRDRALARRSPSAFLLTSPVIDDQLRAIRRAFPDAPYRLAFDRCTECNGPLISTPAEHRPLALPEGRRRPPDGVQLWTCSVCGHDYWEGSHTSAIRARLERVFASP